LGAASVMTEVSLTVPVMATQAPQNCHVHVTQAD
jgi:hypothetical protein